MISSKVVVLSNVLLVSNPIEACCTCLLVLMNEEKGTMEKQMCK